MSLNPMMVHVLMYLPPLVPTLHTFPIQALAAFAFVSLEPQIKVKRREEVGCWPMSGLYPRMLQRQDMHRDSLNDPAVVVMSECHLVGEDLRHRQMAAR